LNLLVDDPVYNLADIIQHRIDEETSNFILSIFPTIKSSTGEAFLADIVERNQGDMEACVDEIYNMAKQEEQRKKSTIPVKTSSTKAKGGQKTTPSQTSNQKKPAVGGGKKKKDQEKSNIILVSELDHSTEISGTPTPTSEVSQNVFVIPDEPKKGMCNYETQMFCYNANICTLWVDNRFNGGV